MAIFKSKHSSNYTIIPNEVFKDNLSIEAIGLLSYFLSLPHDWVIYKTTLHNTLNIGRDKLDKIFKELTDKKYIISSKYVKNGKISYNHEVFDKPQTSKNQKVKHKKSTPHTDSPFTEIPLTEIPSTEKPLTEKPFTENPQLLSKHTQSKHIQSKHIINKEYNAYQLAVDCWLKLHVNYLFNGVSGKHLKQLLDKIRQLLAKTNNDTSDQNVFNMFELIITNLPTWFQDKDLPIINSKFNEIIEQIKNNKNASTRIKQSRFF